MTAAFSTADTDFQHFTVNGIWVKPPRARREPARIDVILRGGDGSGPLSVGDIGGSGLVARSFLADELPGEMPVTVGQWGAYALVVTHYTTHYTKDGSAGYTETAGAATRPTGG